MTRARDFDGDGFADVFVGAGGGAYARLFAGPVSGDLLTDDADVIFRGQAGTSAGSQVAAEDLDGDGYPEALVGAPGDREGGSGAGAVFIVAGGAGGVVDLAASATRLLGDEDVGHVGAGIANPGDVSGDGAADLLIGATALYDPGVVYVALGPFAGVSYLSDSAVVLRGDSVDEAGVNVAAAGDGDGDGLGDMLIGGRGDADGGAYAGAVWLISGATVPGER